jgi:hypothetical protein
MMKKLHEQRLKWKPHGKNSSTWAFLCVDDESLIHVKMPQVMSCMMCCSRILNHALLNKEQS